MIAEDAKLRRPSRLRLVDGVYHSLQEAILSGRMRPGERLVETSIAEQLGVSRTTVREAFLMLERRGLVVSRPRRGTFVTRLSRNDALDLGYTRALLEGFALTVGFDRLEEIALPRAERALDEMRTCRLPDDLPRLIEIDLAFHRALVECAHLPRVLDLWSSLNGQIGALYIRGVEEQGLTGEGLVALHEHLLREVRSGDPERARRAVLAHYVRDGETSSPRGEAMQAAILTIAPAIIAGNHNHLGNDAELLQRRS